MGAREGTNTGTLERRFRKRTTKMANGIIANYRNWLKYRQTCNELNRLTNRELADLGIARGEITKVAKQSAAY